MEQQKSMLQEGEFFDLDKTQKQIGSAFEKTERSQQIDVGRQYKEGAEQFKQQMATFGGGAFDTGASQKTISNVFADMNAQIANMRNAYAIQKNNSLISANQYFTQLASQGFIDPATGSFLKSSFNMNVELNQQKFENDLRLLKEQGKMQEQASMWGALGSIAGMAMMSSNPVGGFVASLFAGDK